MFRCSVEEEQNSTSSTVIDVKANVKPQGENESSALSKTSTISNTTNKPEVSENLESLEPFVSHVTTLNQDQTTADTNKQSDKNDNTPDNNDDFDTNGISNTRDKPTANDNCEFVSGSNNYNSEKLKGKSWADITSVDHKEEEDKRIKMNIEAFEKEQKVQPDSQSNAPKSDIKTKSQRKDPFAPDWL